MATGFPQFQLGARHILADAEPTADDGTHQIALFVDNFSTFPSLVLAFRRINKEARDEWCVLERYWTLDTFGSKDFTHVDGTVYKNLTVNQIIEQVGSGLIYDYLPKVNTKLLEILGAPGNDAPPTGGDEQLEGLALLHNWLKALRFQNKQISKVS